MTNSKFSQKEVAMIWVGIILGACLSYLGGVSANLSLILFNPPDAIKYLMYTIATIGMIGLIVVMLLLLYKSSKDIEKKPEWDKHEAFTPYKKDK